MPNLWWYLVNYTGAALIGLLCTFIIHSQPASLIVTTVTCFIYCFTVRSLGYKELQRQRECQKK